MRQKSAQPLQTRQQQQQRKPGRQLLTWHAAADAGKVDAASRLPVSRPEEAAADSAVATATAEPAAAGTLEASSMHPAAAAPSAPAATLITVGDVCKSRNDWQLTVALRKWAQLCSPESTHTAALDATPVDELLPQLSKYMAYVLRRTAPGSERAGPAAMAEANLLLLWVREHRGLQGGDARQAGDKQASAMPGSLAAAAGAGGSHAAEATAAGHQAGEI